MRMRRYNEASTYGEDLYIVRMSLMTITALSRSFLMAGRCWEWDVLEAWRKTAIEGTPWWATRGIWRAMWRLPSYCHCGAAIAVGIVPLMSITRDPEAEISSGEDLQPLTFNPSPSTPHHQPLLCHRVWGRAIWTQVDEMVGEWGRSPENRSSQGSKWSLERGAHQIEPQLGGARFARGLAWMLRYVTARVPRTLLDKKANAGPPGLPCGDFHTFLCNKCLSPCGEGLAGMPDYIKRVWYFNVEVMVGVRATTLNASIKAVWSSCADSITTFAVKINYIFSYLSECLCHTTSPKTDRLARECPFLHTFGWLDSVCFFCACMHTWSQDEA